MEIHEILALMLTIYMGVSESLCKRNLKRCRSNELCGMYRCLVGSREWVRFCDSEQSINHGLNCPSSPTSNRIYRSNSLPRWWQYNYSQDCGGQKCSNTAATKQQRKRNPRQPQRNWLTAEWFNEQQDKRCPGLRLRENRSEVNYLFSFEFQSLNPTIFGGP